MTKEAETTAAATKGSIIDPKYRLKYKTPDWLAQLLLDNTSAVKEIAAKPATEEVGKVGEVGHKPAKAATEARTVNDGVDTDKLFALARENGLPEAKLAAFEAQKGGHGFEGRIRMTIRNMLQPIVKQRHGLVVNGHFVPAPADFLRDKGVLEGAKPTHTETGEKIAKPATVKAAEGDKLNDEPAPSKLIKADAVKETAPKAAVKLKK